MSSWGIQLRFCLLHRCLCECFIAFRRLQLTLFGNGFSDMTNGAPGVRVWVGVDECKIVEYWSTDSQLVCYTPPAPRTEKGEFAQGRLDVRVSKTAVNAQFAYFKGFNQFEYNYWRTPRHEFTVFGGQAGKPFRAWGTLRAKALSSYRATIGGVSCDAVEEDYADPANVVDGNGAWAAAPSAAAASFR